jgi:hypothetical protein
MWNANYYFETLTEKLLITKNKYKFCRISSIDNLEEVLSNSKEKALVAVDDTNEGVTMQSSNGGYFNRRSVVIFILHKFKVKDFEDRVSKMNEIRTIYNRFLSKIVIDSYSVPGIKFTDRGRIPYHELPGIFAVETCGLYFTLTFDEPTSLEYNEQDWE